MKHKMSTHRWRRQNCFEPRARGEAPLNNATENKRKWKTYREPPPMAGAVSTFEPPLTGDENISVLGANACCCDELPNNPATGCCWSCDPTAAPPNDLAGDPPNASRIESFKSSNALLGGARCTTGAGDAFDLGGGGRAGGPTALT